MSDNKIEKINLDKRLKKISEFVRKGSRVADIGCDHGYLSAFLALNKISNQIIASDVNEAPLKKTRKLIKELNLEKDIKVILSDGLDSISNDGVDEIIIAGMGGELIVSILEKSINSRKDLYIRNNGTTENRERIRLILQPMSFPDKLRRGLYRMGFEILSEVCISDNKHIYVIICAEFSGIKKEIDDLYALLGKTAHNRDVDSVKYIMREYNKINEIIENMQKARLPCKKENYYKSLSKKIYNDIILNLESKEGFL